MGSMVEGVRVVGEWSGRGVGRGQREWEGEHEIRKVELAEEQRGRARKEMP